MILFKKFLSGCVPDWPSKKLVTAGEGLCCLLKARGQVELTSWSSNDAARSVLLLCFPWSRTLSTPPAQLMRMLCSPSIPGQERTFPDTVLRLSLSRCP